MISAQRHFWGRWREWVLAACLAGAWVGPVGGWSATVRLDGDRVSIEADGERLSDLLTGFVRAGVEVRIEPGLDAVVDGGLDDVEIETALRELLGPFNYLLYWQPLHGPVGPLPRLSRIHVFRAGRSNRVAPFEPQQAESVIVRSVKGPAYLSDEVLVGFKAGTSPRQFRELLGSIGGTAIDSLPAFGVYRVRLPRDSDVPEAAAALQRNPWVVAAEPNFVYDAPIPHRRSEYGTEGAALPPPPTAGSGEAAVAIFDTGLAELDGFGKASVAGTYDAVDPGREVGDLVGHGTQMALVATGAVAPTGMEPSAGQDAVAVLAIRSFDDQGVTSNYRLLRGIDYAAAQGGRVLSLSWGASHNSVFLQHAIGYAQEQGMVVVAAVGNEPRNQPVFPAAYQKVVAVSAHLEDGSMWPRSNYGAFVTISGPGEGEFPIGYQGPPGRYQGTSIATAFVARTITRYFQAHPDATADDAIGALTRSVTDLGEPGRDPYYGYGALTADAVRRYLE